MLESLTRIAPLQLLGFPLPVGDVVWLLLAGAVGAAAGAFTVGWHQRRALRGRVRDLLSSLRSRYPAVQALRDQVVLPDPLEGLRLQLDQAVRETVQRTRAVEAERAQLHQILEHLSDGVVIIETGGTIRLLNRMAQELLGAPVERALGRPYAEVLRDYELDDLVRAVVSGSSSLSSRFVELGRPRRTVQALASALPGSDGHMVTVILRDITELRRTETIRRDFIANVSHDLRTPLAGLQALVETLLDGALDDPTVARDFLQRIAVEVDHLTRLVTQLLELTRAEAGQLPLHRVPADLAELVAHAVDRFGPRAQAKEIRLECRLPPALPAVWCDPERIGQVLSNLLDNAVKFTPPGGRITVTAEAGAREVRVAVSDTGPGIPADDIGRIFERFYKGDRSRSASGSGLGLAIVKHLVQLHGGTVWAESPPGTGATVGFTLPRDFTDASHS